MLFLVVCVLGGDRWILAGCTCAGVRRRHVGQCGARWRVAFCVVSTNHAHLGSDIHVHLHKPAMPLVFLFRLGVNFGGRISGAGAKSATGSVTLAESSVPLTWRPELLFCSSKAVNP
jgi:hypothetical protein